MSIFARSVILMVRPPSNVIRCIFTTSIKYKNEKFQEDMFHVEGHEPNIPNYTEREGESIDRKKARLLYQSRKRGMLENGLLLSTFAKKYLNDFDDNQLRMYDRLINLPTNDWDIFYWATGVKPIPPEFNNEIMDLLKKHTQNENRDARIVQPDL